MHGKLTWLHFFARPRFQSVVISMPVRAKVASVKLVPSISLRLLYVVMVVVPSTTLLLLLRPDDWLLRVPWYLVYPRYSEGEIVAWRPLFPRFASPSINKDRYYRTEVDLFVEEGSFGPRLIEVMYVLCVLCVVRRKEGGTRAGRSQL